MPKHIPEIKLFYHQVEADPVEVEQRVDEAFFILFDETLKRMEKRLRSESEELHSHVGSPIL